MNRHDDDPLRPWAVATGVTLVLCLVAAGVAGLAYWKVASPQVLGASLGVAILLLGGAIGLWARHLLPQHHKAEDRHPLRSTDEEREQFAAEVSRGGALGRRPVLVRLATLTGLVLAGAGVSMLRSLGPKPGKAALHTPWRRRLRAITADGRLVKADEVPLGGLVTAFPEGHPGSAQGQIVLIRVPPEGLRLPPGREDWAPGGLVAYSKVCTHAGCPVGLYQTATHTLLCPCHQSVFDVERGAEPLTGPAAWPLPQLPLEVDEAGYVASRGDFSSPVGPGWWKEP